jgi:coenzyme PQQ synthesis protein D (PqqD)
MEPLTVTDDSRVVVSPHQLSCDLAGETAILNLRTGVYYGLNAPGTRIWTLIQSPVRFGDIRDALLDQYEVDCVRLESDLRQVLADLAAHGLVDITA